MATIFFTGFPGFLGSRLLPRVLARSARNRALCLVQPKFMGLARRRLDEIVEKDPALTGRIDLVEGDITKPGLGLESGGKIAGEIEEAYHLAAVYALDVPRDVGMRVNVDGTRNVLDFLAMCRRFERLHYVSTCYVSGRYAGIFRERDLDKGQRFNNHYEETKFLAEVDVQARMREGLSATIYRPSIVVGERHTGATQKFDGPYFLIRLMLTMSKRLAILPVVGDPTAVRFNIVPSDFVVDAIAYLSGLKKSRGVVYQLADPEPLTVDELLEEVARATERNLVRVPMPVGVAKRLVAHLPGPFRKLRIPAESVDYFVHPTHYDTRNAQRDLTPKGITVPPFQSYLPNLVTFVREHPEIGASAMV
ncbi:MAG: NAD-dependent epimerase/dehydratase family protein [Deltaproteobacteria bacterium]|nr:MAG: NAD-dependent epimerase/dehydratase family protein [Deltaproteobacteria bacterium]